MNNGDSKYKRIPKRKQSHNDLIYLQEINDATQLTSHNREQTRRILPQISRSYWLMRVPERHAPSPCLTSASARTFAIIIADAHEHPQ